MLRPAARTALVMMLSGVFLLTLVAVAQVAHPPGAHRHPEAEKLENPIASTPESIVQGRKQYVFYCAGCHGRLGLGDGGMAVSGSTPSNLTDDEWDHGSSDGEIFLTIRDGGSSPDMQPYSEFLEDEEMWHLVNYIRSLNKK